MAATPEQKRQGRETVRLGGKRSGAWLARWALEQLPISHTFGIPGVHNTELYDELNKSEALEPVLVTHEGGGAFAADAISRTATDGRIGCMVIVPAAGITHAMSGVGEAFLDGIPMLVVSGGIRTDVPYGYQLHELDQHKLLAGITKGTWYVERHDQIVPAIFEAYETAVSGKPGPVFVEIPVNLQLFQGDPGAVSAFRPHVPGPAPDEDAIARAAELLAAAERPGIFVGWGAVDVAEETRRIAELLGAPVSTTLQGLSAFPADHPLHTGMGFSEAAVPAATNAFAECDCLLAVGTAFGEIPTGSFGAEPPENLIHMDIDPDAIGRNYPTKVGIHADARVGLPRLLEALEAEGLENGGRRQRMEDRIADDKQGYRAQWYEHATSSELVNPALFFDELRRQADGDAVMTVDDGNHTFLCAELWPVRQPRSFVSPTDFNCMGYAVPAGVGAKLANPERQVISVVGDGAFLMTGMEILTATTAGLGIAYFVFYDGELSQISQGQEIPYNRKTCTIVGEVKLEGMAMATGARYIRIDDNDGLADGIRLALETIATGQPAVVDVRIDYSKRTRFTQGVVKTVLKRFPMGDKFRFIGRAVWRKLRG